MNKFFVQKAKKKIKIKTPPNLIRVGGAGNDKDSRGLAAYFPHIFSANLYPVELIIGV